MNNFDKEISNVNSISKIYDSFLNREATRIATDNLILDIDNNGEIVSYKNLDDYSIIDANKKSYNENELLTKIDYELTQRSDLNDIICLIEEKNKLVDYKLIDCSNDMESIWVLTWCKDYGEELINQYDTVNAVVDAKDGSIMLFGKNKMEPNTTEPLITKDEALKIADEVISKLNYDGNISISINLGFFRPNYFWNENNLKENENSIRLSWEIKINNCTNIQIDAITGENIGGGIERGSDCARAMGVVAFACQDEITDLAYQAFNRLGYNQSKYPPVKWSVNQTDMDWLLSRSDLYGLYSFSWYNKRWK